MWLRNPNYFAAQNIDLFNACVTLFGWDPRRAWAHDFPFYIEQNRAFYSSGKALWPTRLTLPTQ